MADRERFILTIRDRPAEDGPRLVYADWLEEQGDADLAEFIRLQIRLLREPALAFPAGMPATFRRGGVCPGIPRLEIGDLRISESPRIGDYICPEKNCYYIIEKVSGSLISFSAVPIDAVPNGLMELRERAELRQRERELKPLAIRGLMPQAQLLNTLGNAIDTTGAEWWWSHSGKREDEQRYLINNVVFDRGLAVEIQSDSSDFIQFADSVLAANPVSRVVLTKPLDWLIGSDGKVWLHDGNRPIRVGRILRKTQQNPPNVIGRLSTHVLNEILSAEWPAVREWRSTASSVLPQQPVTRSKTKSILNPTV